MALTDPLTLPVRGAEAVIGLVGDIRSMREMLAGLRADLAGLREAVRADLAGFAQQIDDIGLHVRGLRSELRTLPAGVDELSDKLDGLRGDLSSLHEEMRGLRADMEPLPRGVEDLKGRIDLLGGIIGSMADDLRSARTSVEPMDDDLHRVEQAMMELPPKLDEIAAQLDRMRSDLAGLPFVHKS